MRLLHTSDWHLGRTLHGEDLKDAQAQVLAEIVRIARVEEVDAVLVAGDIYDRTMPPLTAVRQLERTLGELASFTHVIISSGNHDSAIRLGFGSLLFTDRIHIRTSIDRLDVPVELTDEWGAVNVYPVPYLDPHSLRHRLGGEEPLAPTHEAVLRAALDRVRANLADSGQEPPRSVVMAHAFVAGRAAPIESRSERDIKVGGIDLVPVDTFDGIDYVALGHLHGPQDPGGSGRNVRYSGSPLRYSFSERNQDKSVTLVELGPDGVKSISTVPLAQPREMVEIRGTMSELCNDPGLDRHQQAWVRAVVVDAVRPERMVHRLSDRFPHLLNVEHQPPARAGSIRGPGRIEALDLMGVVARFLVDAAGSEAEPAGGDLAVVRDLYEELRLEGAAA